MSDKTGCHVVIKGQEDTILWIESDKTVCGEPSSAKRISGQGDLLAGVLTTLASFRGLLHSTQPSAKQFSMSEVCLLGCRIVRRAAKLTFNSNAYSMTTSHVLENIGVACRELGFH